MLYAIHRGNVAGYQGHQQEVIHLVTTAEAVAQADGLSYCFTEGHADMAFSQFFENLNQLEKIDWNLMGNTYWADTQEDMDRSRRRQAEFLVHRFFPWKLFLEIGVMNSKIAEEIEGVFSKSQNNTKIPPIVIGHNGFTEGRPKC